MMRISMWANSSILSFRQAPARKVVTFDTHKVSGEINSLMRVLSRSGNRINFTNLKHGSVAV
jgi:hypothetical protein